MSEPLLPRAEFLDQFKAVMLARAGRDRFSDGCWIADYALETAANYWSDERFRVESPEACVEYDMRYWHDI